MPSTLARFGLTGKTVPPNGLLIRFQRIVRPTLPGFSVAPMTATLRGAKIASSGRVEPNTVASGRGSFQHQPRLPTTRRFSTATGGLAVFTAAALPEVRQPAHLSVGGVRALGAPEDQRTRRLGGSGRRWRVQSKFVHPLTRQAEWQTRQTTTVRHSIYPAAIAPGGLQCHRDDTWRLFWHSVLCPHVRPRL